MEEIREIARITVESLMIHDSAFVCVGVLHSVFVCFVSGKVQLY